MVEIRYNERYEVLDLAGKSVAEVRELYKSEFNIPDRARASLNSQPLKKEAEAETKLCDCDELSFEVKSRKSLVLLGAFLLALAITGGLFAYTYTVTSTEIDVTGVSADYANISVNSTPAAYTLVGRIKGTIGAATLFDVTRTGGYTGDLEIQISLANADELVQDYSFWMIRLEFTDIAGNKVDAEGVTQVISLDDPTASFVCDNWTVATRYVECLGGSYRALPTALGALPGNDPLIFAKVVQASQHQ